MSELVGRKIILTRPIDQAISFGRKIYQATDENEKNKTKLDNYSEFIDRFVLFSPATEVSALDIDLPPLSDIDGLVMTSANAMIDAIDWNAYAHIPLYVVGEATAEKAQLYGLHNIQHISHTVAALKPMVHGLCSQGKKLLYLRGKHIASDLDYGDESRWAEVITYSAEPCAVIPPDVVESLRAGEVGYIAFFSARSARIFLDLIVVYNLIDQIKNIKALCLSEAVLKCVQPFFDQRVYVSKAPDTDAMLNLVHDAIVKGYSRE